MNGAYKEMRTLILNPTFWYKLSSKQRFSKTKVKVSLTLRRKRSRPFRGPAGETRRTDLGRWDPVRFNRDGGRFPFVQLQNESRPHLRLEKGKSTGAILSGQSSHFMPSQSVRQGMVEKCVSLSLQHCDILGASAVFCLYSCSVCAFQCDLFSWCGNTHRVAQ